MIATDSISKPYEVGLPTYAPVILDKEETTDSRSGPSGDLIEVAADFGSSGTEYDVSVFGHDDFGHRWADVFSELGETKIRVGLEKVGGTEAVDDPSFILSGILDNLFGFLDGLFGTITEFVQDILDFIFPGRDDPEDMFTQINTPGFGDAQQIYPWTMHAFDDLLFVGTGHTDAFAVIGGITDEGAGQIQAYDPLADTWTVVTPDGFGDANNNGFRSMATFEGELYAASFNRSSGAEVWRSADGVTWEQTNEDGFGDVDAFAIRGMIEFDGFLYAGVQKNERNPGEVWRYDGDNWEEVLEFAPSDGGLLPDLNNSAHSFEIFNDELYLVTRNTQGTEIWRSDDGLNWEIVVGPGAAVDSGFGDVDNTVTLDLQTFDGFLYAGTLNLETGGGLWRSADGLAWEQVGDNGLGDPDAVYIWSLEVHNDALYIGVGHEGDTPGAEVWRTSNGTSLEQLVGPEGSVSDEGFGVAEYWGTRALESMDVGGTQVLFAGAADFPFDPEDELGAGIFRFDEAASQDALLF